MKRIVLLIMALMITSISSICSAGLADHPTVGVLPFELKASISPDITWEDASVASDEVYMYLLDTDYFDLVERNQLTHVADELSLSMTGLVNPVTAAQVGNLSGAKYLLYGSVNGLSTRKIDNEVLWTGVDNCQVIAHVAVRMIEVETGRVVLAGVGNGKSSKNLVKAPLRIIRIGSNSVDQEQVYDALRKAAEDAVYGQRGIMTKLGYVR